MTTVGGNLEYCSRRSLFWQNFLQQLGKTAETTIRAEMNSEIEVFDRILSVRPDGVYISALFQDMSENMSHTTPPTTPQRVRTQSRQLEHDSRVLLSPEMRHTPLTAGVAPPTPVPQPSF